MSRLHIVSFWYLRSGGWCLVSAERSIAGIWLVRTMWDMRGTERGGCDMPRGDGRLTSRDGEEEQSQ